MNNTIFGKAGTELYDSVTDEFDFTAEPGKLKLLERACKVADTIATLEEAASDSPLLERGSQGQKVISPLISEARSQTALLDKLLKSLGLPDTDEEALAKYEMRQRRAKAGAKARWSTAK